MTDQENRLFRSLFVKFREWSSKAQPGSKNAAAFLTATMIFGWLSDEPVYREEFEKFVKHWEDFVRSPERKIEEN